MRILQGDTGTALTALAEAERLDSIETHALRQSCRILFESGRWEEVEIHLERLMEKAVEDASAFHNLLIARWQTGQYEPAIRHAAVIVC